MALSDYEKQVLAEMEAQLKQADPKLASVMTSSLPESSDVAPGRLVPRRIALGSILALVGLAVVVVGVSFGFGIWAVVLGVLGFVLMVGGVLWALKTDKRLVTKGSEDSKASSSESEKRSRGFMDRQRDRWDNRNE